jgi:hypothetical protein
MTLRVGEAKIVSEKKIREFIFIPSCHYLIGINPVLWQEEYLSSKFVDVEEQDPPDHGNPSPHLVGMHLVGSLYQG